jgi:hypothetical protein
MLNEAFHRLMFPVVVSLIVGTVWVVGWSRDLQAQAAKKYWPALPVPGHVDHSPNETSSLQQVLLKND